MTNLFRAMDAANPDATMSLITTGGMIVVLVLVFYFLLWRPQKKQQRETDQMRNSVERGDVITTLGGIVGIVLTVKEDNILIETSGDKTKIQIQRWAIRSIEKKAD